MPYLKMLHKEELTRSLRREHFASSAAKKKRMAPKKPSHLSKRSVSLPTDLQNTNVKTKTLFWFIPKDNRCQRRGKASGSNIEQEFENHQQRPSLCLEISEKATEEWITTTSTRSFSDHSTSDESEIFDDDDSLEGPLLGLKFVEPQR